MNKPNKFLAWWCFVGYKICLALSWILRACGGGLEWIGGKIYTGGLFVFVGGIKVVDWAEVCGKKAIELGYNIKLFHEDLIKSRNERIN